MEDKTKPIYLYGVTKKYPVVVVKDVIEAQEETKGQGEELKGLGATEE